MTTNQFDRSILEPTLHPSTDSCIHTLNVKLDHNSLEDKGTYQDSIFKYQPFGPSFQLPLRRMVRRAYILPFPSVLLRNTRT